MAIMEAVHQRSPSGRFLVRKGNHWYPMLYQNALDMVTCLLEWDDDVYKNTTREEAFGAARVCFIIGIYERNIVLCEGTKGVLVNLILDAAGSNLNGDSIEEREEIANTKTILQPSPAKTILSPSPTRDTLPPSPSQPNKHEIQLKTTPTVRKAQDGSLSNKHNSQEDTGCHNARHSLPIYDPFPARKQTISSDDNGTLSEQSSVHKSEASSESEGEEENGICSPTMESQLW